MRLLHYSTEPLVAVRTVDWHDEVTRQLSCHRVAKPPGLWLSVADDADDWVRFCRYNWNNWFDDVNHCTEVVVRSDARLLVVSDDTTLRSLRTKFPPTRPPVESRADFSDYFRAPCWESIAALYQGVVIAPYQWSCRLDSAVQWYYGWDAASGCIWDGDAVEALVDRPELLARAKQEMDDVRREDEATAT